MVDISKIIPKTEGSAEVNVSLFILSTKHPGLKQLKLDSLSLEDRNAKLQKWSERHQFVKVIATGDQIFAQVHKDHAKKEITLEGKALTVEALEDDEYEAALLDIFEEHIQEDGAEKGDSQLVHHFDSLPAKAKEYLAEKNLLSDETKVSIILASVPSDIGKMILDSLRILNEGRRKVAEQQREAEKQQEILRTEIKKNDLKKEMLRKEIKNS